MTVAGSWSVYIACRLWPPEALLTGLRDLPALSLTQVPGPDFESDPTYSPEPVLAVPLVAGLDIDNDMTTRATLCVLVCYQNVTFSDIIRQADILELDKGINPNPFPNERYSLGGHIRTIWGCSSPSQESGTSSTVRKGS